MNELTVVLMEPGGGPPEVDVVVDVVVVVPFGALSAK
jgi:hypothetical protein